MTRNRHSSNRPTKLTAADHARIARNLAAYNALAARKARNARNARIIHAALIVLALAAIAKVIL